MKRTILSLLSLIIIACYYLPASAQSKKPVYSYEKTIRLPGNNRYDYLYVNQPTRQLYVTHGSTVDVIDLNTGKYLGSVKGLGRDHGVAIDNKLHRGYVSDSGHRSLVAFSISDFKTIKTISLKGEDEDATILDPVSGKVFVFEGDSHQAEIVDPATLKETNVIPLGGKPEFAVSNGKGLIFNNLEDINKVVVIDVHKMKVVKQYDMGPCSGPSGMALDKMNHRIFSGCRANKGLTVLNAQTGDVIQTLPIGAGVDVVKYDRETHLIFASCWDGTTTIIKEDSPNKYEVVQTLKTHEGARTMALDTKTHKIYLSTSDQVQGNRRKSVSNTFRVLIYKMNGM